MAGLTERDRQVLVAIGRKVKRNSPIEDLKWHLPPKFYDVPLIVSRLARQGFLKKRPHGGFREVQPTEKGWKQIVSEREYRKKRTWTGG